VRDGLYTGAGNKDIWIRDKSPYVHSQHGAEHCIVDLAGFGYGFLFGAGSSGACLEGFTIRDGECGVHFGGYTGATMRRCIITGNAHDDYDGAGVSCYVASPTMVECWIVGNAAPNDRGGGIYVLETMGGQVRILNCVVANNVAHWGGGIFLQGDVDALIRDCLIYGNSATGSSGGGLYYAPYDYSPLLSIQNCTIVNNHADGSYAVGGGMVVSVHNGVFPPRAISNCILYGNSDTGGRPQISFSISPSVPTAQRVAYCDIQNNQPFGAEFYQIITTDPLFVSPADGDFHLSTGSPCINAGAPEFVPAAGELDMDGQQRVWDGRVDMGADEYYPFADCNANGIPDDQDIAAGTSADCNDNQMPDECEWEDCNDNGVLDECDLASGTSPDCNGNGIPDDCERDCNGNGVPDDCDIAAGTSQDADGDGIPDECEWVARVLYVDDDAPDDPGPGDPTVSDPAEDGSAEHPFDALQKAIEQANSGDEVIVADGWYSGAGNAVIDFGGRDINVHSAHGPLSCTIDLQGTGPGFKFHLYETNAARVAGFTIRNGWAEYYAGGIDCEDSSPTIEDCIVTENISVYYAAITLSYSAAVVRNCRVSNNDGSISGGGGVDCADGDPTIANCLISGNVAVWAAGIGCYRSRGTITGCTIVGNTAENYAGGIMCHESSPVLRGCIVWGNTCRNGLDFHQAEASHPDVDYCDLRGELPAAATDGGHNLHVDPALLDYSTGHLANNSPCIDTGDPAFAPQPGETDIDGRARVAGGRVDIGACEYDRSDCNGNGVPDAEDIAAGASTDCDGNGVPDECQVGGLSDCNGSGAMDLCDIAAGQSQDCNQNGVPDECELGGDQDCNGNGISDLCEILAGSVDINANGVPDECESHIVLYVDDNAPDDPGPGDPLVSDPDEDGTQQHPFDAIQKALNVAPDGTAEVITILVANGIYAGVGNRDIDFLGKRLTLRSADGAPSCVIDCQQSGRGFHFHTGETSASRLIAVTVFNGLAEDGAGVLCAGSSPLISGCTISNCSTGANMFGSGGGLYCYNRNAEPFVLDDCRIYSNSATDRGGGIYLAMGRHLIRNCRIVGNQCTDTFDGGGGLYASYEAVVTIADSLIAGNSCWTAYGGNDSSGGGIWSEADTLTIRQCTLSQNLAGVAGGAVFSHGYCNAVIYNSIIWGNIPAGSQIAFYDMTLAYCDIAGGVPVGAIDRGGNIATAPQFVDPPSGDFHLLGGSPCVDAGDPAFVAVAGETDLDGQLRTWPGSAGQPLRVDIGVDEYGSYAGADVNCDDLVNVFDIDPFILALTDPVGYAAAYPGCDLRTADLNYDGSVNAFDIDPFVAALTGQ
jgi:hypothetical protein